MVDTHYYEYKWKNKDGTNRLMKLLGMDKITSAQPAVDVSPAYALFPLVPAGALDRPVGDVGVLIGGGLGDDMVEQLRVMTIPFSSGYVPFGHSEIKEL